VGSARLAARNRDAEHLDELERALTVLRDATGDDPHDANVAFHAAVARAGGNDLFILTLDALEPLLRRLRSRVWNGWVAGGGDRESIIAAHATVLERIRDGDEDGAGQAMTDHLRQARVGLESPPGPALSRSRLLAPSPAHDAR
jgi:DNA-binding FadR family transcriptional regulator